MATEEEISPLLAQESDPPGLEMRRLRKESIRWVLQEGFGEGRSQWIHLGMSRLTESLGPTKAQTCRRETAQGLRIADRPCSVNEGLRSFAVA